MTWDWRDSLHTRCDSLSGVSSRLSVSSNPLNSVERRSHISREGRGTRTHAVSSKSRPVGMGTERQRRVGAPSTTTSPWVDLVPLCEFRVSGEKSETSVTFCSPGASSENPKRRHSRQLGRGVHEVVLVASFYSYKISKKKYRKTITRTFLRR